jgi:DNA-binding transcriptional MocR family regulator
MGARSASIDDWLPLIRDGGKPVYRAVADAISDDLRSGRLRPGARLPPQRRLAQALGVDLTTITRAYNEARRRGLIDARVGRGSFIRERPAVHPYGAPSGAPVDMTMNMPPPFQDAALVRRMWAGFSHLEERQGLALFLRYQDPGGIIEDRAAGAEWLQDRIPGLGPDRTLVAAGAQAALVAVFGSLANSGDAICAESLAYPGLRAAAAHLGLEVVGLETDEEGVVPAALAAACRDVGPKLLCCTPTLHNPTTATMSLRRREEVVAIARRYRLPIVEDDAYGKLPQAPPPPLAALAPELTWHVVSLAKLASPALRLAYVVTPDSAAAVQAAGRLRAVAGMASPISAALMTQWIRSRTAEEVLRAIRAETRARRRMAAEALGPEALEPTDAFHLWLRLPAGWTRARFQAQLQAHAVSVIPSDAFVTAGPAPEAVRLGLGAAASRADLAGALTAIALVLDRQPAWGAYA